jgi:hypothetical protein
LLSLSASTDGRRHGYGDIAMALAVAEERFEALETLKKVHFEGNALT